MQMSHRYQTHSSKIISETIDGETIIINLDSGHYFSLNQTAGEIWNAILTQRSMKEIVQGLVSNYETDETAISASVQEFLDSLLQENLISKTDTPTNKVSHLPSKTIDIRSRSFEKPSFQKYNDMQDLLLLDPIHDVDESGWPKTAQ